MLLPVPPAECYTTMTTSSWDRFIRSEAERQTALVIATDLGRWSILLYNQRKALAIRFKRAMRAQLSSYMSIPQCSLPL